MGLIGGTFVYHYAHLAAAEEYMPPSVFTEMVFIPAGQPPTIKAAVY